ncbi:hypothetical protein [uncultured Clostridium sp.]|uniref:hypothetical protein n=1 Tax=uncultured Clostridium sp. TaxID=59620 RepID=UPI0025E413AB|nr:hypothetical protein [uncultured Clostridium sp.]MDU4884822.1 hypothetical protein [Clostridium celatum]MDU7078049.1 hypothetical protein [Clostridium celatum]
MGIKINGKKRIIIGVTIGIALTIIATLGIGIIKVVNANKITTSIELGKKYLKEQEYDKAQEELLKVTLIESDNEEALDLIELTKCYIELENLYQNKEYILASELIAKIKGNKYLEYIEQKVNEFSSVVEEKISIINEINNIDGQIDTLISENKYEEAISLINNYLGQDITEEYFNKLNTLMSKVNNSKSSYEEEVKRIAAEEEEKRLEEERKKQEELANQQEMNKQEESITNSESVNTGSNTVNKEIYQLEAVDMALEVVRKNHPGYGPHYFERGLVSEGEMRWAFIFLKLEDPNATSVEDSNIIGKVGYTVNVKTGEVKQEDWLVN